MSNKLQNIKAVKQMLDGTHKFQTKKTHGYSDTEATAKKNQHRDVGDIWEETIGSTIYLIEQKDGFREKKPKNSVAEEVRSYLNSFQKCPKETCTCITPNHVDEKMRIIHQMCLDCVVDMEHELKKQGKYDEYEKEKMLANANAWLKKAEDDVKMLKKAYTEAQQYATNADGLLETWDAKMTSEEFENTIEKEFKQFKINFLNNINKKEKND